MPAHRVEYEPVAVPSDIRFGLGMTPFGAITLAGTKNWLELLTASNVFSVRRKAHAGYNKTKCVKPRHRSRTFDDIIFTKGTTAEKKRKKKPPQSKADSLPKPPTSVKPRVPAINIIKASNESIPDMYISESSDEESDYEDGEDFVYECPGLAASAEDMTVENPLFQEKHFQSSYRTPELPKKYWKDVFVESV